MSDDIAFRIQLGLILPKIKETVSSDLMTITKELVSIVQAGTVSGEAVDLGAIKEILMKDLEIFVDNDIFPVIDKELNPPVEESDAGGDGEEAAEEAAE